MTQPSEAWIAALFAPVEKDGVTYPPRPKIILTGPSAPQPSDDPANKQTIWTFPQSFTPGGDIGGDATNQIVAKLSGIPLNANMASAPDGAFAQKVAGEWKATSGALSVNQNALPATLNVSTDGALDWIACVPSGPNYRSNVGTMNKKVGGGWLVNSFDWFGTGGWGTVTTSPSSLSVTSNSGDDCNTPLSASQVRTGYFISGASSSLTLGYAFRVPAVPTSRRLRIYTHYNSCVATLTATLTDGSAAPVANVGPDPGVGAASEFFWEIDYSAATPGAELIVKAQLSTNHGSSPNFEFWAITLS